MCRQAELSHPAMDAYGHAQQAFLRHPSSLRLIMILRVRRVTIKSSRGEEKASHTESLRSSTSAEPSSIGYEL